MCFQTLLEFLFGVSVLVSRSWLWSHSSPLREEEFWNVWGMPGNVRKSVTIGTFSTLIKLQLHQGLSVSVISFTGNVMTNPDVAMRSSCLMIAFLGVFHCDSLDCW